MKGGRLSLVDYRVRFNGGMHHDLMGYRPDLLCLVHGFLVGLNFGKIPLGS